MKEYDYKLDQQKVEIKNVSRKAFKDKDKEINRLKNEMKNLRNREMNIINIENHRIE